MSIVDPDSSEYIDIALRREARWRRQQHDRRGITIALVVALVAHLIALWFVQDWMRLRPFDETHDAIVVRLIEPVGSIDAIPPPPLPEPLPRVEPVVRPTPSTPSRVASVAAPPAASSLPAPVASADAVPSVRLYGVDGKIDVSTTQAAPTEAFAAPAMVPQTRKAPALPYRPSAFASQWPSDRENAFQEFVRKRTVTKSWRTRWGGGFSCSWSLFVGGCGWGYAPPNPEGMRRVRVDVPIKPPREEPSTADAPPPWGTTIEPHGP